MANFPYIEGEVPEFPPPPVRINIEGRSGCFWCITNNALQFIPIGGYLILSINKLVLPRFWISFTLELFGLSPIYLIKGLCMCAANDQFDKIDWLID